MGWKLEECQHNFDWNACYCACPRGPCEHSFGGHRDITDDEGDVVGGEQVCSACGLGAMAHSIRTSEF